MKDIEKEFKPSSWAIDNRTSIFVITAMITLLGIFSYNSIPKESFPEIKIPKIFISTVYPGTSPANMENLVTKPIEKKVKSIEGVKKITSNSYQNYSVITVEFNTDVKIDKAKLKVKDEIDKVKQDLPKDLPQEPSVQDVDLSQLPILNVNISGDFDLNKLKNYADQIKDQIESLKEITRADIIGALDREIQINVDMFKMQAAQISMYDIRSAVGNENLTISGGDVKMEGLRRTINVKKEFKSVDEIENMIIKSPNGAPIYLKDIAEVKDTYHEQQSYARLGGKNVITLSIIKRSGANLIEATDKIQDILSTMRKSLPKDLHIVTTGDQSFQTRQTLHDLINTIIIGFILVTIILMFFMGATNALFVAMSVPLSMFVAFLVMPSIGFTMNMIVLFSFLLALGIVVDDAIVVIENTHRIFANGKKNIREAAKLAAGEVFFPVLAGTLTTLAPFIPLAFWNGVIGQFMFFLPITLIITLLASLLVAYFINPVFAVAFMKPHDDNEKKSVFTTRLKIVTLIFGLLGIFFHLLHIPLMGNLLILLLALILLNHFILQHTVRKFQTKVWPRFINGYEKVLTWSLKRPVTLVLSTIGLFFFSIMLLMITKPNVVLFPSSDPNFTYVYVSLPVGTDQAYTNEVMKTVEARVNKAIEKDTDIVSSVIANVTVAVTDPQDEDQGTYPNKGRVSVSFIPFGDRHGKSTTQVFDKIEKAVKGIAGAEITVAHEQAGPPTPKPISIEITGDNLDDLIYSASNLKHYLDSLHIDGVQELKSDFLNNKPEIVFDIDRERANREGISAGLIGSEIRNAVFGQDQYAKFRDLKDEYPIQVRYKEDQRNNVDALRNMKITYRDMAMGGQIRQVPLATFADIRYEKNYGAIKRKNQKRIITLSSNVTSEYRFNPNGVVDKVQSALVNRKFPDGVSVIMAGEQEDQKETSTFMSRALGISVILIFLILVTQFNSIGKPLIIITEIVFSVIGVFLGVSIFRMDLSIVMTGIGVVALAGIVVRNGILLVEFADLMMSQGMNAYDAIVEAGKTRMTPVLLTASATILGLIPLAVGMNIDFVQLLTHFNPHLYFGGDSVAFWGPLSWTMIFGLGFATFLTLILVPVMYVLHARLKAAMKKKTA
ncbi:MAG TPA: efflux RND transporter permease subunit [Bacteroidia bacterium]|jgi:multidrug efflux pump|nr:efflux RND transporter permease subunit [Bacteroidia bacterium]